MTRVGLLGGTFDPLHIGHVALARAALNSKMIDRLVVMVSGQPPHKTGQVIQMAGYRYEMACRVFEDWPAADVSNLEILRDGPSYTIRTIRDIKARSGQADDLFLIYGADVLRDIANWYKPEQIMSECTLLLSQRPGYQTEETIALAQDCRERYGARISFFDAPQVAVSSSQIREAISQGKRCNQWLPGPVSETIQRHGLYTRQSDLEQVSHETWQKLADYERAVWPYLKRKRLLHSLNVMVYAIHLALRHKIDVEQAAIASLLHDCAKDLPIEKINEYAKLAGDPSLLGSELGHGPAGAWLAKTRFGITDPAVLRAIHYHTTGCAGMTALDKIIFIADKVEPARTYDHLEQIRDLVEDDLDAALRVTIDEIGAFLKRENLDTHPYTQSASDEIDCRPG